MITRWRSYDSAVGARYLLTARALPRFRRFLRRFACNRYEKSREEIDNYLMEANALGNGGKGAERTALFCEANKKRVL